MVRAGQPDASILFPQAIRVMDFAYETILRWRTSSSADWFRPTASGRDLDQCRPGRALEGRSA